MLMCTDGQIHLLGNDNVTAAAEELLAAVATIVIRISIFVPAVTATALRV
jgi:hypothetical protein